MILQNRLKSHSNSAGIQVIKDYQELQNVECFPGLLNQVFMNILINAIDALEERDNQETMQECDRPPSTITIRTYLTAGGFVAVSIADNGGGYQNLLGLGCLTHFSPLNLWVRGLVWGYRFLIQL
ncbi:hypothetical protein WME41_09895 [Microcoleus anatoxicus PTRS3]|uniref:Uncharacterized protein n=1 Tax=Microcoleus anatoxicus PTRS2 TaxID=2705321 RepID=A0ABU8YJH5_9CYAN